MTISEPTVQGGTRSPAGRGRGQGQTTSAAHTRGRPGTQRSQPLGQPCVFALTQQEAATVPDVIIGNILLYNTTVCALIDPSSTHSFISTATTSNLHQSPGVLGKNLMVSTPLGESIVVRTLYRDCAIQINMVKFLADLIFFPLLDLDIILGMDWLSRH